METSSTIELMIASLEDDSLYKLSKQVKAEMARRGHLVVINTDRKTLTDAYNENSHLFTSKMVNFLTKAGFTYLDEIAKKSPRELMTYRTVGHKTVMDIRDLLSIYNLKLTNNA